MWGMEEMPAAPAPKTKTCYYWGLLRFARNDNSLSCSSPGTGVSVNKKRGIGYFTLC
ncbi:MAG: hypothetical protein PHC35_03365 [Deltaproteobacteria bacterium]|nr:hypothetical protein [Deltaproteobacteria bacterium]